jgi:hypothetical protein
MHCVPDGRYEALAVAPLASGKLDPPDIALFYATPGAMIYFINGLQWSGYKRFDWSVVGESACADSWGRALKTPRAQPLDPLLRRAPLRRRARRRDADGAAADYLIKAIAGMKALAKNGFRYPFPQYGVQQDVRAGMAVSYPALSALLQSGSLPQFLIVGAVLGAVHFVLGNIVSTVMLGRTLNMSPLAIILALSFWGLIWGVAGLFLAVPMTGALVIICEHVDGLRWFAVAMAGPEARPKRVKPPAT